MGNVEWAFDLINDGTAPNSGAIAASGTGGLMPKESDAKKVGYFNEVEFRNGSGVNVRVKINGNPNNVRYAGSSEGFEIRADEGQKIHSLVIDNLSSTNSATASTLRAVFRKVN